MPKLKIVIVNGRPATPGVTVGRMRYDVNGNALEGRDQGPKDEKGNYLPVRIVKRVLVPEGTDMEAAGSNVELMTTADVADVAPYQDLLDRGILTTVAGRPKATASA